jgi:hypothetical protein
MRFNLHQTKIMANEYCCFLERDTVQFGRHVTTFVTKVLFNIRLAQGEGISLLRKNIPLQAWRGT